jgi:hypothetical protein
MGATYNGSGRQESDQASASTGLGTALVAALAKQLKAQVWETSSDEGMAVAVTKATFESRLPKVAEANAKKKRPAGAGRLRRNEVTYWRAMSSNARITCD